MALVALWPGAAAAAAPDEPSDLPANSWLLVDERSGDVLAAHEPDRPYAVASATKLMTAWVAMRALDPRDQATAPTYEAGPLESLMGLEPGERVRVRDLLYGLLLASGNDAAQALALRVAGSVHGFVARMNRAAERLGLRATKFTDPAGLDAGNRSSARDLTALATDLRRRPLFRKIVASPRATVSTGAGPTRIVNRNALVRRIPFVDGVKTGSTLEAGYILVASAHRQSVRLVSVVLGAPGESERDAATLRLLRYGASLYRERGIVRRGETLASVALGAERGRLDLVAAEPVVRVARSDQRLGVEFAEPSPPSGPVARGQSFGTATITLDGRRVATVEVVAARAAAAAPSGSSGLPEWAAAVLIGVAGMTIAYGMTTAIRRRRPR